jgi:hypothetical protein
MRMKFYPDDYRYTLAKLLQGCDAIIDQSAEPTQDAESPAENPCHPPNTPKLKRLVLQMTDYAEPVLTNVELNGNGQVYCHTLTSNDWFKVASLRRPDPGEFEKEFSELELRNCV